uniref:Amphiregulin n=1 Tax=Salvator merianae TaxID=96440 RepID=A0A8D0DWF1_SALMN
MQPGEDVYEVPKAAFGARGTANGNQVPCGPWIFAATALPAGHFCAGPKSGLEAGHFCSGIKATRLKTGVEVATSLPLRSMQDRECESFIQLSESQAKAAKSESGKKNPNKPKRKGSRGKKNKKKAVTPCEEKFKKYCVHGDCIYIEHLEAPSCKCYTNYFGERCVEQFLKTQKNNEATSSLIITRLPGILAVVLSAHCFAAIVVLFFAGKFHLSSKFGHKVPSSIAA